MGPVGELMQLPLIEQEVLEGMKTARPSRSLKKGARQKYNPNKPQLSLL